MGSIVPLTILVLFLELNMMDNMGKINNKQKYIHVHVLLCMYATQVNAKTM